MLARLEAAFEQERGFVADAGHELRTPLALLRAELDYALRYAQGESELRAALHTASEETDRLVQLAGDLLPFKDNDDRHQKWIATGLLVLGPKNLLEPNREKLLMDVADEQIDVTSRAFLGLTVSCARCHDHKFDPIPTRDYYALAEIFRST